MIWHNPSALPVPSNYVGVERIRLKQAVECLWWLSPDERPYADNKAILEPYSDRMLALIKNGGAKRSKKPSGHATREGSFSVDNGGSIAPNIFQIRSEEHTSELQSLMRISYAVFCLKKKKTT